MNPTRHKRIRTAYMYYLCEGAVTIAMRSLTHAVRVSVYSLKSVCATSVHNARSQQTDNPNPSTRLFKTLPHEL